MVDILCVTYKHTHRHRHKWQKNKTDSHIDYNFKSFLFANTISHSFNNMVNMRIDEYGEKSTAQFAEYGENVFTFGSLIWNCVQGMVSFLRNIRVRSTYLNIIE